MQAARAVKIQVVIWGFDMAESLIEQAKQRLPFIHTESGTQYTLFRKGLKDGVIVYISNPPWGRFKSPMVDFRIFKDDKEYSEGSYESAQRLIKQLVLKKVI